MADPARKLEAPAPESAPRPVAEEEGVVLAPDEEDDFERMIAETDEEVRAGRVHSLEEVLARLRAA